jgi:hypothetical protein
VPATAVPRSVQPTERMTTCASRPLELRGIYKRSYVVRAPLLNVALIHIRELRDVSHSTFPFS